MDSTKATSPALDTSKSVRELEMQTFDIAFETILERMSEGIPFSYACSTYHTHLPHARFRSWIFSNRRRKEAYLAAKALSAEAVEDELLRISDGTTADGSQSIDDVQRSKLKIDTRKWLLQVWNRQRYGEVKQIEQKTTTTLDVSTIPSAELQQRLLLSLGMEAELFAIEQEDAEDAAP